MMELLRLQHLSYPDLLRFQSAFGEGDRWLSPTLVWGALGYVPIDFKRAYREFGPAIRRIGLYKARLAPADADDFVHEVFERVWKTRSKFRGESALKTWIFGFAYNVARNFSKRQRPNLDGDVDFEALACEMIASPEERAMSGEAEAQLALALEELEAHERKLFIFFLSTGNLTESAQLCGVSHAKAEHALPMIRERLAKIIARLQRDRGWRKR